MIKKQILLKTLLLSLLLFTVPALRAQITSTLSRYVSNGNDDAEETAPGGTGTAGAMDLTSSDLEIMLDGTKKQLIGMRFANMTIPKGSTITNAYIQFATKGDKAATAGDAAIRIQLADDAGTFTATAFNISSRSISADSIIWAGSTSSTWGTTAGGTRGTNQRTPDLKTLVQQVVNRNGWVNGNALSIILTGTGVRNAYSYNGDNTLAPELVVEYQSNLYPMGSFPVSKSSTWKYRDSGNVAFGWMNPAYNDSSWSFSKAKFGYGDTANKIISFGSDSNNRHITSYFRYIFTVSNSSLYDSLVFRVLRDDGAVVYVNGTEAFRMNMPAGTITNSTLALSDVSGTNESAYHTFTIDNTLLNGTNVIAVEVHQSSATSNDMGFDLEVAGKKHPMPLTPFPITKNSNWNFLDDGSNQDSTWRKPAFDDGFWEYGPGKLGYSDAAVTTLSYGPAAGNKYITYYFRKKFNVSSVALLTDTLIMNILRDDGAVIYMNGVEVARTNMPTGTINHLTKSFTIVDGADESTYYPYLIPKNMLVDGMNTIAVEVHQRDSSSSDLGFDLELKETPRSLVLTSPNGNETWQAGSTHNISWNSAGIKNVKLEYTSNGSTWNNITNSFDATKGFYTWILPVVKSANYAVRVSDSSNTLFNDTSDARFTVASDTLIFPNAQWKYFDKGTNLGTTWKDSLFVDTAFATGIAEFGYGDGGEATLINACGTVVQSPACSNKYITTYFRKKLNIPNLSDFNGFSLQVVRDDGAVVYVNGSEVWRSNLPAGTITYTTQALTAIGGADESAYQVVTIPTTFFVNGENTIAVEIHQESGTSSDVSFNLRLKGIQAPVIPVLVTAPNGGESWTPGSVQNITWQAQSSVGKVKIEYSVNGTAWNTIISSINAAAGTYSWLVPNTPSTNVLVKISDTANVAHFDTSHARFTITTAPAAVLLRGPYLQMVTQTSANLRWRTDVPAQSRVRFGTAAPTLAAFKDDSAFVTEHEVKITGLSPYTTYYYSIGDMSDTLQGDASNYFRTIPPAGADDRLLRIGVIGDCGNASTNQINVRNRLQNYLGANYMDSWILLGDNAYSSGTDNEFQAQFFNIYKDNFLKQNPLWPAPGNHDYQNGSAARQNDHNMPYYDMFTMPKNGEVGGTASGTEAYYSFDIGNVHFLSLDSYGKENNATRMYDTSGAQVTWIKNDLAANQNNQWVVAYWHHPPYTKGSHNSDTEGELVSIRQNFIRILERYGVDLILCGHSHDYERSKIMQGHYGVENTFSAPMHHLDSSSGKYDGSANSCPYKKDSVMNKGTVYVVAGSAGQLGGTTTGYPHDAMYYSNATNGGSMVLEVLGNRLDAKWICADGVVRDQFTMMKDVNAKKTINATAGDTIELTASFVGNYNWNVAGQTTRMVKVVADSGNTVYTVGDNFSCLKDSFVINGAPLPVKWNEVKAWYEGKDVKVYWQTAQEINNKFFEVERSADGKHFTAIGRIMGSGNSGIVKNYEYVDQQPLDVALVYYRIRQIDYNGRSEHSKTVSVKLDATAIDYNISIMPNPGYGAEMRIRLNNRQSANAQLVLTDVSGMSIINRQVELTDDFQYFLPELKPGFYFLTLTIEGTVITRKLIIK